MMGTIVRDTNIIIQTVRKIGWNVDLVGQFAAYDTVVATLPGGATRDLLHDPGSVCLSGRSPAPRCRISRSATRRAMAVIQTSMARSAIPPRKWF